MRLWGKWAAQTPGWRKPSFAALAVAGGSSSVSDTCRVMLPRPAWVVCRQGSAEILLTTALLLSLQFNIVRLSKRIPFKIKTYLLNEGMNYRKAYICQSVLYNFEGRNQPLQVGRTPTPGGESRLKLREFDKLLEMTGQLLQSCPFHRENSFPRSRTPSAHWRSPEYPPCSCTRGNCDEGATYALTWTMGVRVAPTPRTGVCCWDGVRTAQGRGSANITPRHSGFPGLQILYPLLLFHPPAQTGKQQNSFFIKETHTIIMNNNFYASHKVNIPRHQLEQCKGAVLLCEAASWDKVREVWKPYQRTWAPSQGSSFCPQEHAGFSLKCPGDLLKIRCLNMNWWHWMVSIFKHSSVLWLKQLRVVWGSFSSQNGCRSPGLWKEMMVRHITKAYYFFFNGEKRRSWK